MWAVERIVQNLKERFPFVTASYRDGLLWNRSQNLKREANPYYRTYTTAY